jgi:hypothetical protein
MGRGNFQKIKKPSRRERNVKFEWRSCKSKAAFEEFDAKRRANELGLRAYECSFCNHWHLTKQRYER